MAPGYAQNDPITRPKMKIVQRTTHWLDITSGRQILAHKHKRVAAPDPSLFAHQEENPKCINRTKMYKSIVQYMKMEGMKIRKMAVPPGWQRG